jgi:hypothetical protein
MEEDAQLHSAFSNRRMQPARDLYSLRMNSNHKPDSQTLNLLVIFCGIFVWQAYENESNICASRFRTRACSYTLTCVSSVPVCRLGVCQRKTPELCL